MPRMRVAKRTVRGEVRMRAVWLAALLGCICTVVPAQTVSPLFARGYTVLPEPREVTLQGGDFSFGSGWQLRIDSSVPSNDVAVESLRDDLSRRFHVTLDGSGGSSGVLSLRVTPGSVPIGEAQDTNRKAREEQAYRIELHDSAINIT